MLHYVFFFLGNMICRLACSIDYSRMETHEQNEIKYFNCIYRLVHSIEYIFVIEIESSESRMKYNPEKKIYLMREFN